MEVTKTDVTFKERYIILKSVYDKANIKYYIHPCRDKWGNFPPCVKRVDSNGDMILSEAERGAWSEGSAYFIPEDAMFEITSGKKYDLEDLHDRAEWEAIKNCPLIAQSRDLRDSNGNLVIDGTKTRGKTPGRNGVAELYIDRPGLETEIKVKRKQLIHKAESYIYDDSEQNRLNMVRILGRNMSNQPTADVIDFLVRIADKDPQKIINLYTGDDITLRLLFIEAKDKRVIYIKNKLYLYGDNIVLGATDDAVIAWMRDPKNKKVLDLIKKDTYPDYFEKEDKK